MANASAKGDRVEIRGLCSFYVKKYKEHAGRNPKTGEPTRVKPKKPLFLNAGWNWGTGWIIDYMNFWSCPILWNFVVPFQNVFEVLAFRQIRSSFYSLYKHPYHRWLIFDNQGIRRRISADFSLWWKEWSQGVGQLLSVRMFKWQHAHDNPLLIWIQLLGIYQARKD